MPMLREIVLQMLSTWPFHESLLSTQTPKNLMEETSSRGVVSNAILLGRLYKELLKSMNFVF